MIVVAGWLRVDPAGRASYLAGCRTVIEQARAAPGCLDFTLGADLLDTSRINVFERWSDAETLLAFRQSGPDDAQQEAILDALVHRYEISSESDA